MRLKIATFIKQQTSLSLMIQINLEVASSKDILRWLSSTATLNTLSSARAGATLSMAANADLTMLCSKQSN
jgi:hypothetical protein